jgi:2-polyprenyl-6-methoxyphenol hydroxylase-like FAD-dependent oxidoreductase
MTHENTPSDRAVVLGGGMAGLLAARALADHFTEVIVVDRDDLGPDVGLRRGVPQARHTHALLAHGRDLLERLFPGLTDELIGAGTPAGDMLADTYVSFGGHRFAQGPSGLRMLSVTRPALERAVRRRVAALPGVTLLGGRDVVGLVTEPERPRVRGVRVFDRADGSAEEQLGADLVVEATGRGSRLPTWLEGLGLPRPPQDRVEVGVGYTSRRYHIAPAALDGVLGVISGPTPDRPRGGALSLVEDGEWLLTLMGVLGDHPPTDDPGMLRFAADLHLPDLHRALAGATPLNEPVTHRHPVSVSHRYDRMAIFPDGLTVVGDAGCCLNPIYGQGMTVAAMQAVTLHDNPHATLRELARSAQAAWILAEGADLSFPGVPGRRTPATRMLARYVDRVQAGAATDPRLGSCFLRVISLVDPPSALLRPGVLRLLATAPHRPSHPESGAA